MTPGSGDKQVAAVHEAAHAVVGLWQQHLWLQRVAVCEQEDGVWVGQTTFRELPQWYVRWNTDGITRSRVLNSLAGPLAEARLRQVSPQLEQLFFPRDDDDDVSRAFHQLLQVGLPGRPKLTEQHLNQIRSEWLANKVPVRRAVAAPGPVTYAEVHSVFHGWVDASTDLVDRRWRAIRAVGDELVRRNALSGWEAAWCVWRSWLPGALKPRA